MTQVICEHCGAVYEVDLKEKKIFAISSEGKIKDVVILGMKDKKRSSQEAPESKKRGRPKSKPGPKRGQKFAGRKNKYPKEMKKLIKEHMQDFPNNELVTLIKRQLDIKITKPQLAAYMNYNGLKRKAGAVKSLDGDDEEDLPKLPPENY